MSLQYLHGATSALTKPEAWRDWQKISKIAAEYNVLIDDLAPKPNYGVKRIDKCSCRALKRLGISKEVAENDLELDCCFWYDDI